MGLREIDKSFKLPKLEKSKLRAKAQSLEVMSLEGTDPPQYRVASKSKPGTWHIVTVHDLEAGRVSCDCQGYENRGECTHIGVVVNYMALLEKDIQA